jgi:hypothetical protein
MHDDGHLFEPEGKIPFPKDFPTKKSYSHTKRQREKVENAHYKTWFFMSSGYQHHHHPSILLTFFTLHLINSRKQDEKYSFCLFYKEKHLSIMDLLHIYPSAISAR